MTGKSSKKRGIAATLQAYVSPLLEALGESEALSEEDIIGDWRMAYFAGGTIWNAVVMSDKFGIEIEKQIPKPLVMEMPEEFRGITVEQMVERKRTLFSGDLRLIGECSVTKTPDGKGIRTAVQEAKIVKMEPSEICAELEKAFDKNPKLETMGAC